jgi:Uma2 family endonuclease
MTTAIRPNPAGAPDPVFRLSVDQYHAMIRTGILTENDSVELLEGWLIKKMSQNPPHSVVTELTAAKLRELGLSGWCVRSEKPITLSDSEPEPDVALARGSTRTYVERQPSAADVAMVVEVADATLQEDQGLKLRVYARAGIPIYWIINVNQRQVEVHSRPTGSTEEPNYADRQDYTDGSEVPVVIDGRQVGAIHVAELLP